jgi:heptosyltransferase-2
MTFGKVRKILLFRLCCLGDVAMLTPVITNLHNRFPDAEIKIAASKWIENLLPYLPVIKEAIVFDAPFNKNIIRKITGTIGLIFRLRKEKFDLVFLAHRNNVYGLILKLSGIRCRLGFSETKYINYPAPYEQDLHFVERHLNILSSNGMEVKTKNLSLIPKPNKKELLNSIGLTENDFIFGIFPFGGSNPGTQM